MSKVGSALYTHDKHQWLLLQFIVILTMDAKVVRNMYSIPTVVNKHNTARVASCWFIIYYRLVMPGNLNIKYSTRCNSNLLIYKISSTCFGQSFAHPQERETEIFTAYGILLLW